MFILQKYFPKKNIHEKPATFLAFF